ncbi:MAG: hypothetical protein RML12_10125 [Xanthomonadales bacterium]|nr:hypothetical protein [Xanthomonadales bacterium]
MDEAFLDGLGNYVLCRSHRLFQESLPEQIRSQLRARIQRDSLKKACHERILERQRVEYPALARNQGPWAQVRFELAALGRWLGRPAPAQGVVSVGPGRGAQSVSQRHPA